MTVNGGVIVLGLAEDKTAVAREITSVALKGTEERIRQVAGSRISPAPEFELVTIPGGADGSVGVIVVVVPASPRAPHQANGKYPCRRGTVTEALEERDVERLYEQRRTLSSSLDQLRQQSHERILAPFAGSPEDGVGYTDLLVHPVPLESSQPAAWQGRQLE